LSRGVGTTSFKRECGNSLHLRDVLYVLGLKKNLVFVSTLEDKGYVIIFNRCKDYLKHLAYGSMKKIGVRINNLYRL